MEGNATLFKTTFTKLMKDNNKTRYDGLTNHRRGEESLVIRTTILVKDKGLVPLILDRNDSSLSIGDSKVTIQKFTAEWSFTILGDCIKSFALNVSVTPVLFEEEFLLDFLRNVITLILSTSQPATALKDILFQCQCLDQGKPYKVFPNNVWTRFKRTPKAKGVHGMAKAQKEFNLPPGPLQYNLLQLGRDSQYKGHAQSLIRPFEVIPQELSYDYQSIVSGSTADPIVLREVSNSFGELLDEMIGTKLLDPSKETHLYGSYRKGPNNKAAIEAHLEDLEAISNDPELEQALYELLTELSVEMRDVLFPYRNEGERSSPRTVADSLSVSVPKHSKLSFIPDGKFGKTRVVAVCDVISQSALTGINWILMEILISLYRWDLTFHQDQLPNYISYYSALTSGSLPSTSDCTAFTDRLPRELNIRVIKHLFGDKIGDLWETIVCKRKFTASVKAVQHGVPSSLQYAVGTPMGLLTSWSSSALVHHLIIRHCHRKVGVKYKYIILGDDMGVWDRRVYSLYQSIMRSLGLDLSEVKSTNSPYYAEFAKRSFTRPRSSGSLQQGILEVTGLPGTAAHKLVSGDPAGIAGYANQLISRQSPISLRRKLVLDQRRDTNSLVIQQLLALLLISSVTNRFAFNRFRHYLATWIFTDNCDYLTTTIRLPEIWTRHASELLTSIHGTPVTVESLSLSECLTLNGAEFLPKHKRLAIWQSFVFQELKANVDKSIILLRAQEKVQEETGNLSGLFRVELLSALSIQLSKRVLEFLFSDVDMSKVQDIMSLYDYRSTDILNRIEQIYNRQNISRRDLSYIRESKLGKKCFTALSVSDPLQIINDWEFHDYMCDFSNMAGEIDSTVQLLNLSERERTYLDRVIANYKIG